MEPPVNKIENTATSGDIADGELRRSVVVELPLGDAVDTFDLEKAVCSHGLFMMAPNHWDSLSKTLKRPLRLDIHEDTDSSSSLLVQISHPSHTPGSLSLRVFGTDSLSPHCQQSLMVLLYFPSLSLRSFFWHLIVECLTLNESSEKYI